jgi:hypothetical protein
LAAGGGGEFIGAGFEGESEDGVVGDKDGVEAAGEAEEGVGEVELPVVREGGEGGLEEVEFFVPGFEVGRAVIMAVVEEGGGDGVEDCFFGLGLEFCEVAVPRWKMVGGTGEVSHGYL